MAQHNQKEETELHFTGTLTLTPTPCVDNRGVYGPHINEARPDPIRPAADDPDSKERAEEEERALQPATAKKAGNRCLKCGKRVGLTGYRCRCGDLFCGAHRYSDRHGCGFDYKAVERERIQRENPVVRASKIVRI